MELYTTLSSVFTVLSFVAFLGIVHWAYSGRRREAFAEAANAPFALPDETPGGEVLAKRETAPQRAARRASR